MKEFVARCAAPQARREGESPDVLANLFQRAVIRRIGRNLGGLPAIEALHRNVLLPVSKNIAPTSLSWQPEIGTALTKSKQGDPASATVHALFAMHALGQQGRWSMDFAAPRRFSVDGHFFDLDGVVTVDASADRIGIDCRGERALELRRTAYGWTMSDADRLSDDWHYIAPQRVDYAGFESVYLQPWREPDNAREIIDIVIDWPPQPAEGQTDEGRVPALAIARQIAQALDTLAIADPCYLDWIKPLFRGMATTPLLSDGMRQSGSYVDHPGVFNCGFPTPPEALAEVIVHEMSHQYLMLLSAVVPLVNATMGEVYYSSLKGRVRTLDRVLLAYHACANMSLFWLDLIAREGQTEPRDEQLSIMLGHTCELADVLEQSKGLTEAGRLLFETQVECLQAKGWMRNAA